jgi:hypothetical protein
MYTEHVREVVLPVVEAALEAVYAEAMKLAAYYVTQRNRIIDQRCAYERNRKGDTKEAVRGIFEKLNLSVSWAWKKNASAPNGRERVGVRIRWMTKYPTKIAGKKGQNAVPQGAGPMYDLDKLRAIAKEYTKGLIDEVECKAATLRAQSAALMAIRSKVKTSTDLVTTQIGKIIEKAEAAQVKIIDLSAVVETN